MRDKITWEEIGTYDNLMHQMWELFKKKTKRQCVRCWVHLYEDQKLWCSKCINRVDEELNWEASRPYDYYFRHYIKRLKHDERAIWERTKNIL